ncbi:MAG: ABC transporter permease [Bacteroidales bacterium]|nr:ABC transporter permease [Bacteroidales bacterium]
MNTEYFIAKRFTFDKEGKKLMSRSIVQLSVFSISLSIAVMIISLAVVTGFKKEIRNKVVGFGSHIQIVNFDANNSFESIPISSDQDFLQTIKNIPQVKHLQVFATKPGIIKAGRENQGVIAKGVGSDFDWSFFNENLVEGSSFLVNDSVKTNEVLISKRLSSLLKLNVGEEFIMFFFGERPRPRRFKISGIFETSLEDFDEQFIIVDIGHIQKLYDWDENQISGFEILIEDYSKIEDITSTIRNIAGFEFLDDGSRLRIVNIIEKYPQIFHWLNLLDMNVFIILLLMIVVAVVNMISGLIIIILDRTNTIGLLKSIGACNQMLKRIFLYQAFFLILKGLFIGNIIAIALCYVQDRFQCIKLNRSSYFIDYVPINLTAEIFAFTNIGSLILIFLAMFMPALIIMHIDPVKTLRYN